MVTHRFDRSHEYLKPMDDELRVRSPHWGLVLKSPQTPAARVQAKAAGRQASRGHIKAQNTGSSDWVEVPCLFRAGEQRGHGNALKENTHVRSCPARVTTNPNLGHGPPREPQTPS